MRTLLLGLALFTYGCGEAAMQRTEHKDGFGFSHPAGWLVESFEGMARAYAPDTTEFVAVGPVAAKPGQGPADIIRAMVASRKVGPMRSPTLLALREEGEAARALLTVMDKKAQMMVVLRGGAGTLYLLGAPKAKFAARLPELVKILESFRLQPPQRARQTAAPSLNYQRVTEPKEYSFSVEFPAGWRTDVGIYREGALAPRFEASAVAPEGEATIFLGERNAGSYTVPTPELQQFGMREGMTYNPTGVNPMPILRYLPGEAFARYWLGMRLQGARETGARALPAFAQKLAEQRYRYGNVMNGQVHAGELEFDYQGQKGRVTVATEVYGGSMGVTQWSLIFLAGHFAAEAKSDLAASAVAHAVGSSQVNLEWLQRDRYFARMDHQKVMATLHYTNDLFRQTMAERSESNARKARAVGDTLAGTYRVLDPTTNEYTTVQAGSNFYYRVNNTNTVFGTNQEQTPVDITRMLRIDWDTQ
ncbi:MAG: hypothetical protein OHK0021_10590 [Bryobacter sp.]